MSTEFTNRKDDVYYLHQGTTKTGKPKYYCSRKRPDVPVQAMPDGYEWRENPATAIVTVRKVRPTRIAEFEKDMLSEGIRKKTRLTAFIVDIDGDSLVVYTSDRGPDDVDRIFDIMSPGDVGNRAGRDDWFSRYSTYGPMMRFSLEDEDERFFRVERWCFRGSIDGWYVLDGGAPLAKLIAKYVPHLGQESFYELM